MLIAVGMYLPFSTTFAIFVGGIIKFFMDKKASAFGKKKAAEQKLTGEKEETFVQKIVEKAENVGLLLASGLVAGEALTGILLAGLVLAKFELNKILGNDPHLAESILGTILYFAVFAFLAWLMISIPLKKLKKES